MHERSPNALQGQTRSKQLAIAPLITWTSRPDRVRNLLNTHTSESHDIILKRYQNTLETYREERENVQKIAQKIEAQIILHELNGPHMYECPNIKDNDYRTNGHTVQGCSFLALKH